MKEYPFTLREQDAIRELGKCGFRYVRETKKTIEFHNSDGNIIELNREHSALALVFGFGDSISVEGVVGFVKRGDRASSNFAGLETGITRNGRINHVGQQIIVANRDAISPAVGAMLRSGAAASASRTKAGM